MATLADSPDAAQMRRHARAALIILTFINLFNYIDRYVFAILGETLKKPTTLGLTDGQLGWVGASFMVVYALTSPVFGTLGDRQGRSRLIASGVAIWSVGTMLGGFARGFWTLLGGRSVVGVGEAAYGSIAPAVLSDHYPKAERGRVLSIFYIAIPVGAALGYILGGEMDHAFGWRAAFFIAGAPGLVLALLLMRLRDPQRGTQDDPSDVDAIPHGSALSGGWPAYRGFFRNRPYMGTVLGYAAYTFGLGAMSFWMPMFLQRVRGFTERDAGTGFGKIVVITGLVGTLAGGWLGDRLLRHTPRAYLYLAGVTTLIAAPLAYAALTITDRTTMLWTFFAVQLLLFASTGPVNSAILNAVIPTQRATAMAFSILMIHLLGDVPSPILIGNVSFAQGDNAASLQHSLLMFVPPSIMLAGIIWMATALWSSRAKVTAAG